MWHEDGSQRILEKVGVDASLVAWDYWALVPFNFPEPYSIIEGEAKTRPDLGESERQALQSFSCSGGFITACLPGVCAWYFVSLSDGQPRLWVTAEEAKRFLGDIDTPAEAVLIAMSEGYDFDSVEVSLGGIRGEGDSFLLLALRAESWDKICDERSMA